ncbi:MAG: division/cell wall cluster transcriptional repressor MraZ [FCB group bacterium]|nr:division/cell wall cluster transcriptional repressor MraZ [FCB group bacterium]
MYLGEAITRLDEKGRITIPRAMRDRMEAFGHIVWYMTRGFDGSIFMVERSEWDKLRAQIGRFSAMDAKTIDFRRFFFGSIAEVRLDAQGRMAVPQHLREYAGLDKDVVVLGVDNHIELWDREAWRAYQRAKEAEFREMAGCLFSGDGQGAVEKGGQANGYPASGSGIG